MEEQKDTSMESEDQFGLYETSVPVASQGRITVPAGVRDILGIEEGDPVTVEIHIDGDDNEQFSDELDFKGRVNIPGRIDAVEQGEKVDVTFRKPVIA